MVSLRLRLEKAKRHPGCLDLENDPITELSVDRIVRDEHVQLLAKENAQLVAMVGELQARLREAPAETTV